MTNVLASPDSSGNPFCFVVKRDEKIGTDSGKMSGKKGKSAASNNK